MASRATFEPMLPAQCDDDERAGFWVGFFVGVCREYGVLQQFTRYVVLGVYLGRGDHE